MRRYSFSLMLYISAAYGMEKNEDDYLRKLHDDIIVTHICPYIFFPEQPHSKDGLRSLLRFSKTSKKNKACVELYLVNQRRGLLHMLHANLEHLSKSRLTDDQKNHVARMNMLVSSITSQPTFEHNLFSILCQVQQMHEKRLDLNRNILAREYSVVSSYGMDGSIIKCYEWYIPKMPLIEACRMQRIDIIKLLLAYGADPYYSHSHRSTQDENAFTVAYSTKNPKIIELIKAAVAKKSGVSRGWCTIV